MSAAGEELPLLEEVKPLWTDRYAVGDRVRGYTRSKDGVIVEIREGSGGMQGMEVVVETDEGHRYATGAWFGLDKVEES